jgi:glycine amidinotransferase/scyllo-inosamine-4-phosphate amidinotransferase 1
MINSHNEWDQLRVCVVGDASHANWPSNDPVFMQEKYKTLWKETPVPSGQVARHVIDESNEDLATLSATLRQLGVEVIRPSEIDFGYEGGMYNYCPRDRLLIAGDTIIDTTMMYPCRDMEIKALQEVTSRGKMIKMPRNKGMVLDAANVCRLNDTYLMLESESGNIAASQWLQDALPHVTIETCNFYAGVHIDSTIVPLREGLVMLNASRVHPTTMPKVFENWQKIWITEGDVVPQSFYSYPYASKWIAMNMLVINPNLVIVDKKQSKLMQILKDHNIESIPLELRHSRTLGGGFHCVTLDLIRS